MINLNKSSFSPGKHKFLKHLDHISNIIKGNFIAPLHISIWPTIRCQLNCSYCCCKNNKINDKTDLDFEDLRNVVDTLSKYGTKAIEFSGGGEPLLWPHLDKIVDYIYDKKIKMSLITNGLELKNKSEDFLSKFAWIRVSLQNVNHAENIDFKRYSKFTKISASYIVYKDNYSELFNDLFKINKFSIDNNLIIRIAVKRPCEDEYTERVKREVENFNNSNIFFSYKESGTPKGCYMPWVRAAITWDGKFIPCPNIQLSSSFEGLIPKDFELCNIKDLENWIINNKPHDLGYRCDFCNCGKEHNDLIYELKGEVEDAEFV